MTDFDTSRASPNRSIALAASPLAGERPVTIALRDIGAGTPLLFLHGGWGYQVYPFDRQIAALAADFRIVIPDRSGYGASTPIDTLGMDFHRRAMGETLALLDALDIEQAIWWGHSDGAVIAAVAGIEAPGRVAGLILEALHLYADKPRSRAFFTQMAQAPDAFSSGVTSVLRDEHGEQRWRTVLRLDGEAWRALADAATHPAADLYQGRLGEIGRPTLLLHGEADPRTEPGEFEALTRALPTAEVALLAQARHSPHSEAVSAGEATRRAANFLQRLR